MEAVLFQTLHTFASVVTSVKVTFSCHAARRGSRSIALLRLNLGEGWAFVVSATPRPLYPCEETLYLREEAGSAPGPILKVSGEEEIFHTHRNSNHGPSRF